MDDKKKSILVVLGMHRSGTSAITRGLQVMGVELGDRMMPSVEGDNAKGYWEDIDLNALNIEMLRAIDSDWNHVAAIDSIALEILRKQGYFLRAAVLLRQKASNAKIFGFKDPRVAKLLPFWKEVFSHCQFDVSYVMAVRHPLSVVKSLAKRGGIEAEQSFLLWLGHVLTSLTNSVGDKRVLVDYDRMMQSPERELMRVAKCTGLEIDSAELQNYKNEFLDPGLRHTVYDLNDLLLDDTCPPIVREVYTALLDVASDKIKFDNIELHNKLMRWADEFDRLRSALLVIDRIFIQKNDATQTVAEREGQIASLNRVIASFNQAVAERDGHIAGLNQSVADCDEKIVNLNQVLADRDRQIALLTLFKDDVISSTSWRVTRPLRVLVRHLKQNRGVAALAVGLKGLLKKSCELCHCVGQSSIKQESKTVLNSDQSCEPKINSCCFMETISCQAANLLEPRILIIGELSIPQCTKYRVEQKQEMFKNLGFACSVQSWTDTDACMNALSICTLVIFYRVPAFQDVLKIIAEAKRLGIQTIWEVDDLVFDREVLSGSKNLTELDQEIVQEVLQGAVLYRTAMLSCDKGIASTPGLASVMEKAGVPEVFVIENALDQQTFIHAEKIKAALHKPKDQAVRIVYGSGTNTHNVDFKEAAIALLQILSTFPEVRLRLIGTLELPEEFTKYRSQIERIPFCTFDEYLGCLAECDISIAPLEGNIFNDAKSNIKFLEAAVLRIPSVCSPRAAFRQSITHGVNGFLCETQDEWFDALTLLVTDTELREKIGLTAYESVVTSYSSTNIAKKQLVPILKDHKRSVRKKRILTVNIFYSPRSFGGATIVAEGLNKILNERGDSEIHVFTTLPLDVVPAYMLRRYTVDGVTVFGVGLPESDNARIQFENSHILTAFESVLLAVQPDLVHFHSIQGIGVGAADLCVARRVPYIVTLHDAWWLCGRQFMINQQGTYCNQEGIDTHVCAACVDNADLNYYRQSRLHSVLKNAVFLLSPSQFFADFYIKNGFSSAKVLVNKNGIHKPVDDPKYRRVGPLSFGYVGGNTEIKGVHLVKKVFADLADSAIKLVVVDNALNLGCSSYDKDFFKGGGSVEIVPAYTQKTIDNFFSSIDVLLFPTQCKESFGLTVREALARNVWVIATDAGGVVEDIYPGKNGFIIPFDDNGQALKQAMLETIQYYQRFKIGDEICLETTQINWFEDQANELAGIYKRCIDDNIEEPC